MSKLPREVSQESLSEAHEKYQDLIENLSVGVYRNTPGPKGHFLVANSAIVRMFEAKSKAEFIKHNVSDLYRYPVKRKEFVAEIMQKGEVKNKEVELVTLKGKKIIGSVTAVLKKTRSGEIYFDGIIEDITKRKKMESELRQYHDDLEIQVRKRTLQLQDINKKLLGEIVERKRTQKILQKSNDMLESAKQAMLNVMEDLGDAKVIIEREKAKDDAMLASIGEGMIAVDNLGQVILMNKAVEEILGFSRKDLKGKLLTNLVLEDEGGNLIPLSKHPTTMALAMEKTVKASYYFVRKNKMRFPIAITATPIKLGPKTIGLIEIIRDISTELEIDKAKSEFVSLASHQLRTPLGIVKWYMEAIVSEEYMQKAPLSIKAYFQQIYKSNERVLCLVRDLLSVSRIDQGNVKDTPTRVDLTLTISEMVAQMLILAKKRKIGLHLHRMPMKKLIIKIDTLRFHEVIENLLSNAIEYSKPGGSVEVVVGQVGDLVSISVSDNGIGISSADQKKLFTKFFRTENAVAQNAEGSGLGLYVVKAYVEGWGGTVTVKSTLSKGSSFTITLPIKKGGKKI